VKRGSLPSKCRRSRETFHHAHSTAREPRGKREQILCVHHGQSQQAEYFHFLKYAPAKVGLFATRNSRRIVSGRRLMKRFLHAGLAIRLLVATLSPASGAPALNEDVRRGIADPSVQSWKSGGETSTLPWSAPRGHHQPRLGDVPVAPSSGMFAGIAESEGRYPAAWRDRPAHPVLQGCIAPLRLTAPCSALPFRSTQQEPGHGWNAVKRVIAS